MYKKIYVEISNKCRLNCSFCSKDDLPKKDMNLSEFTYIIKQIKPLTNYIYLHIKGEPMEHPDLESLINIAYQYNIKINITTSGINLIDVKEILIKYPNIYQINISLHSYKQNKLFNNNYFDNIFKATNYLLERSSIKISYRLWDNDLKDNSDILDKIKTYFDIIDIDSNLSSHTSYKIKNNLFLNKENSFIWPNLNNANSNKGYCYGLTTHFGILVDGTVIPCCLDSKGIIKLGNIFNEDINTILNSSLVKEIKVNFKNNKRICELCQKCHF